MDWAALPKCIDQRIGWRIHMEKALAVTLAMSKFLLAMSIFSQKNSITSEKG
jgi:hypothetical protein